MNSDDFEFNRDSLPSGFEQLLENPGVLALIALLLVLPPALWTMFYQVDRDEEAVVLRFGAYDRVTGPGLHYKWPYPLEKAYIVNTHQVFSEEFGFRSAGQSVPSQKLLQESLMLTGDLGVARVQWEVQYRKVDPKKYLFNIRDEKSIIREASFAAMRRIVGDREATQVITTGREQIAIETKKELQDIMDSYNSGIRIDDVPIHQTEPPSQVLPAFKEVDSARQDKEKFRNEALEVKERRLNVAQGKVQQMVSEAQGDSIGMINRAMGEAEQFERILEEYRAAPAITETRLFLETMEQVLDQSNRVYVVDDGIQGLLPHLDLKKAGNK